MFGFLKDIADNVKAELSFAAASTDSESYGMGRSAVIGDGYICQCIDDDIDRRSANIILKNLENGESVENIQKKYLFNNMEIEKVLSAKRDIDYFRKNGYDDCMIIDIGKVSRLLCINNDDTFKVSEAGEYDIELVDKIKAIRDEYLDFKRSQQSIKPFVINAEPVTVQ